MGFSVGIGLTNDCNLSCAHCYRDASPVDCLTLAQVQQVCASLPVDSVSLGAGENALNPEFDAIVAYLRSCAVRLSVASNGYTLTTIPDQTLQAFDDVEVSLDFPTQAEQDAFRAPGSWAVVQQAIDRCFRQGVEVSILLTLMSVNFNRAAEMVELARRSGLNLRVNAYQPVKTDSFRLSYQQFWQGYRELLLHGRTVFCSEPVVRAAMGLEPEPSSCGRQSLRVNPRGQLLPCAYWPVAGQTLPTVADLATLGTRVLQNECFQQAQGVPGCAQDCLCSGGCASRRALAGDLDTHDPYCPWARGDDFHLAWQPSPTHVLVHAGSQCTTVVV